MTGAVDAGSASGAPQAGRLRSLDGLRGVASLVVLLFHALLISPIFGLIVLRGVIPPAGIWTAIAHGPLRLIVAGPEAVTVFFVLSGFVLTRLGRRYAASDWPGYFPQRLVRLWLPALGSLVLTVVIALATHRAGYPGVWVQSYTYPHLDWRLVVNAANLLGGNPDVNSPLWSLQWEVVFSLLLPVFVLVVGYGRRVATIALIAAPVLVFVGLETGDAAVQYLPMFLVGSALCVLLQSRDALEPSIARPASPAWSAHLLWAGVAVVSLLLLVARSELEGLLTPNVHVANLAQTLQLVGAAGIVAVAARWAPAVALLGSPLFRWLGRISFSLYLVHVPILVGTANVLRAVPWPVVAGIGILISLGVAVLFSRFVEQPSHRLSQRIGRAAARRFERVQSLS